MPFNVFGYGEVSEGKNLNVSSRTLANIVLVSFLLSLSGVLVDADHLGSYLFFGTASRYYHVHLVAVFGGLFYGSVVWAFMVRWCNLVHELTC